MTSEREQEIRERIEMGDGFGAFRWVEELLDEVSSLRARLEQAEKALARAYELTDGSDISAGRDEAVTLRYRLVAIEEVVAQLAARAVVSAAPEEQE